MSFPIGFDGVLIITLIEFTTASFTLPLTSVTTFMFAAFKVLMALGPSQLKLNEYGENIHYKKTVSLLRLSVFWESYSKIKSAFIKI
jgi:hypothetical protein